MFNYTNFLSLEKLCFYNLWETLYKTDIQTLEDVDLLVEALRTVPVSVLSGILKLKSLDGLISDLVSWSKWSKDKTPWLQACFVLRCFDPVLSEVVVPIRQMCLPALQIYPKWENIRKIRIFLNELENSSSVLSISTKLDHVTHLAIVHDREDFTGQITLMTQFALFSKLNNVQVLTIERLHHVRILDNLLRSQEKSKELRVIHIKQQSVHSITHVRKKALQLCLQMEKRCYLEEIELQRSNCKDSETIYNFVEESEPPLLNYFFKKGECTFSKMKSEFIVKDLKSLHMANWHYLMDLEMSVSCLDFAEIVHTIGTQLKRMKSFNIKCTGQEKVIGDSQDIAAIDTLCNIPRVRFIFGKVSPTCFKAALALTNTEWIAFVATCFTEMDPLVMKDCFQSRNVPVVIAYLSKDHNNEENKKIWNQCQIDPKNWFYSMTGLYMSEPRSAVFDRFDQAIYGK